MRFMLISHATKDSEAGTPPTEQMMGAIGKMAEDLYSSGAMVEMGGLMPTSGAAKLRLSGGKIIVTDGPFTESKEIVAGYAIVDVKSRDEAIAISRRFFQAHLDALGSDFELTGEVRQMYEDVPGQ